MKIKHINHSCGSIASGFWLALLDFYALDALSDFMN
jgi:hypothetical protein